MLTEKETWKIPHSEHATDVIGDVGAFMRYYRRGIAYAEWKKRMREVMAYFDDVDAPHISAVWSNIVIPSDHDSAPVRVPDHDQQDQMTDQPPRNDTYVMVTIGAIIVLCVTIVIPYAGVVNPGLIRKIATLCGLLQ